MNAEKKICPNCGTEVPDRYCPNCGTDMESINKEVEESNEIQNIKMHGTKNKKFNVKTIMIALACLVTGIGIGIGFSKYTSLSNGEDNSKEIAELNNYTRVKQKYSDNKNVAYLKDYKGLNVSDFAQYSDNDKEFYDYYSDSNISITFIMRTEDGSKITKKNAKDYIVKSQDYKPNTKINIKYEKNEHTGEEYEALIDSLNPSEIELRVIKIKNSNK